jgi:hypothetical protein
VTRGSRAGWADVSVGRRPSGAHNGNDAGRPQRSGIDVAEFPRVYVRAAERGPYPPGYWQLMIQYDEKEFPPLGAGILSLVLKNDVSHGQAEKLAKQLRRGVDYLAFTPS